MNKICYNVFSESAKINKKPVRHLLKQKDNKKSAVHGHCLLSHTGWFNKDNNTSKSTLE